VKLKSSPNPSKQTQPVTFTVSVAGSLPGQVVPTGTVVLKDGASILTTLTLQQGRAKYVTSALGVGTHVISASYSGSKAYNPNQAQPLTQTVTP
jgi:hypothetical protein